MEYFHISYNQITINLDVTLKIDCDPSTLNDFFTRFIIVTHRIAIDYATSLNVRLLLCKEWVKLLLWENMFTWLFFNFPIISLREIACNRRIRTIIWANADVAYSISISKSCSLDIQFMLTLRCSCQVNWFRWINVFTIILKFDCFHWPFWVRLCHSFIQIVLICRLWFEHTFRISTGRNAHLKLI